MLIRDRALTQKESTSEAPSSGRGQIFTQRLQVKPLLITNYYN